MPNKTNKNALLLPNTLPILDFPLNCHKMAFNCWIIVERMVCIVSLLRAVSFSGMFSFSSSTEREELEINPLNQDPKKVSTALSTKNIECESQMQATYVI